MFEKMSDSSSPGGEKQGLLTRVLDAVKQCQIRFGGKTELATESDSRVCCLCAAWESILQHGLLHNNKALSTFKQVTELTGLSKISTGINILGDLKKLETEPTFWPCVKELLSPHELQRYTLLQEITSDAGRGRAWLRSALNEHSLERFMHTLLDSPELLSQYYEDWAFLRDQEKACMLPNMAAGLGSILFAIVIDKDSLNSIKPASGLDILLSSSLPAKLPHNHQVYDEPRPVLAMEGTQPDEKKKQKDKKKKKKPVKIVSFDETDISSYSASPASSVTSPKSVSSGVNTLIDTPSVSMVTSISGSTSVTTVKPSALSAVASVSWTDNVEYTQELNELNIKEDINSCERTSSDHAQGSLHDFNMHCENESGPEVKTESDKAGTVHSLPGALHISGTNCNVKTSGDELKTDSSPQSSESSDTGLFIKNLPLNTTSYNDVQSSVRSSHYSHGGEKGLEKKMRHSDSITSTNSMTSNGSSNSEISWPEEGTTGVLLSPVSPDGQANDVLMFSANQPSSNLPHSQSVDFEEAPLYNEWTRSARDALDLAQKGLKHSSSTLFRTQGDGSTAPDAVTSDAMSSEELKQAVIAMMTRKDAVENENKMLRQSLLQEQETCAALRAEIDDIRHAAHNRQERDENFHKSLSRENDLLKHQLKKYVNAVQMLRRQGAQPQDFPGLHMESAIPEAIPSPPSSVDYSQEATEYEQKLIQVAEMHGELMEFNEMLQKQLLSQETTIRQLTTELVSLRGPLPERPVDDTISVSSESNAGALISVWIPSAFLRGQTSEAYHVYQVYVRIRDEEWNVYRRYTEFSNLHSSLKKKLPVVASFDFPKKKAIGNKGNKFVEERRKKLEAYTRKVINLFIRTGGPLANDASKQKLLQALPFFGETAVAASSNKTQRRRGKVSAQDSRSSPPDSQRYTGL